MSIKKLIKQILDINNNGKIDWWEYIVIGLAILGIEIIAELVASLIIKI